MNSSMKRNRKLTTGLRRGAVTVEAALIVPILVLVTIGSIDIGQFINLSQMVSNSSREGARIAGKDTTESVDEVENAIMNYFYDALPNYENSSIDDAVNIQITQGNGQPIPGGDLSALPSGTELLIQVDFEFSVVRWIRGPNYFDEEFRSTVTICRRE